MALHHEQVKIVERIIAALESGVLPWRKQYEAPKGYQTSRRGLPFNAVSGRSYSGINTIALLMRPYPIDGGWLTYRQAVGAEGFVRKGEKSTVVFYWQKLKDLKKSNEAGKDIFYMLCKSYLVFHVTQCDNLNPAKLHKFKAIPVAKPLPNNRIASADEFIANTGASIQYGHSTPCYIPALDIVGMPESGHFVSPDAFYSTMFHELGHWTGPRLGRNQSSARNVSVYGYEELIAELCSCFTLPQFGLSNETSQEAYLAAWIKALKETPAILMNAASAASTAATFLNAFSEIEDDNEDENSASIQDAA